MISSKYVRGERTRDIVRRVGDVGPDVMVYLTCAVIGLGGRGVIKTWTEVAARVCLYMLTSDLTSLFPPQFSHWLQVRKVGTVHLFIPLFTKRLCGHFFTNSLQVLHFQVFFTHVAISCFAHTWALIYIFKEATPKTRCLIKQFLLPNFISI